MDTPLFFLKLATAVLGLTLPGYALARALRLEYCLAAAFPLSALIICQSVTALAICGCRITFAAVAGMLAAVTAVCGVLAIKEGAAAEAPVEKRDDRSAIWFRSAWSLSILLLLAAVFRTILYPLGGFDTYTRWNSLALEMLRHASLSFYPPVSGADFSIYTMPDGFPPLVASVYWWIYAATGNALPQLSVVSVSLQLVSILGLTWAASRSADGERAASLSLLALTASPLLIHSVLIAQETGFLVIAVAGQLCFALAAVRRPSPQTVAAAALFAALAALARDYGPALALPGFLILVFEPATRRQAWKYALLAAIVSSPWYIRNWIITGSPLYPLTMPGSPFANQFLTALVNYYGEIFGIANFGVKEWLGIIAKIVLGGSIALLAGLSCLVANGRRLSPYALSLLLMILLWLGSISKTSGGVLYSIKVLAPAIVILAIAAGKGLADPDENSLLRRLSWLLIPASLWGILSALSFPLQPAQITSAILSRKGEAPEFCDINRDFAARISSLGINATGILTDSPYLAVILQRETRFRPVIIWSREVSSDISPLKTFAETETLLLGKGISLVAMNRTSMHNELLFRTPFYREGVKKWREVVTLGDWVLFAIDTEAGR